MAQRLPLKLWAPPLAVTLLALLLRLYRLTAQSLWFDEGWSVYLARQPVSAALPLIAGQGHTHPPGYYLLLHIWSLAAGTGEFAVRFLSVAMGVLLVAVAYQFMRRWFGPLPACLAAGILALSPVHIVYSQETRMYELLALEYLALLSLTYTALPGQAKPNLRLWLALLALEVATLYTHYFAGVLLVYLNAFFALVVCGRFSLKKKWLGIGHWALGIHWAMVQILALVAFLPWLGVALRQTSEHVPRDVQPPGLAEFLAQTWHFFNAGSLGPIGHDVFLTHLSTALGGVTLASIAVSVLVLADIDAAVGDRWSAIVLAAHSLVPLAALFAIAQLRPGVHPRYVMMLSVPLGLALALGLAILLTSRHATWRLAAAGSVALLLVTIGVGLNVVYFDGRYFRDDVRGLANFLGETATSNDLVLFDYDDYAFRYYDRGPATVAFLSAGSDDGPIAADLARLTSGKRRVFRVAWTQGQSDYRGVLPFLLEWAGRLEDRRDFTGFSLFKYLLERPVELPPFTPRTTDFGVIRVTGVAIEDGPPADNAVAVGLRWHLPATTDRRLKAALRLIDPLGNVLARSDIFLLDAAGRGTAAWHAGNEVTQYAILPLLPGTPPLDYALRLSVYDAVAPGGLDVLDEAGAPQGREVSLGNVRLAPPAGQGSDPYRVGATLALQPVDVAVAPGLILDAYGLDRDQVQPGEKLGVSLRWHAGQSPLPEYQTRVRLARNDAVIAEAVDPPAYGRYPTTAWSAGEIVLDRRELRVPAEVAPGPARLEITMAGGPVISLADVSIVASEHIFTPPVISQPLGRRFPGIAELLGYDVEQGRENIVWLTLYWRALAEDAGTRPAYTVFTHLLNPAGVLVGQHDGPPAGGRRPTTGWIAGEIITDIHAMQFRAPGYTGPALVEVGLYDPATGARVVADDGQDHLILPDQLLIGN